MAHPEALARRALDLTDRQDWAAREALLTADCEFVTPSGAMHGPAAMTAYSEAFLGAFPGARHQADRIACEGDVAVVEGVWVGTHEGTLVTPDGEVPATGRTIRLPFVMILVASGDLVASLHVYFDQLSFLGQLGLLPQPQAA